MKKKKKSRALAKPENRIVLLVIFMLYIALLLYFLFFSERYGRNVRYEGYRYNLTPLSEIRRYLKYRSSFSKELFMVNIVGNIAAFIPFGCLLAMLVKRMGLFKTFFCTALFSLLIESFQLLFKVGSFDVDDIILNTLGGVLGYVLTMLIGLAWTGKRK